MKVSLFGDTFIVVFQFIHKRRLVYKIFVDMFYRIPLIIRNTIFLGVTCTQTTVSYTPRHNTEIFQNSLQKKSGIIIWNSIREYIETVSFDKPFQSVMVRALFVKKANYGCVLMLLFLLFVFYIHHTLSYACVLQ